MSGGNATMKVLMRGGAAAQALLSMLLLPACGGSSAPGDKPSAQSNDSPAQTSSGEDTDAAVGSSAASHTGSPGAPSTHDASVASGSTTDAEGQEPATKPMDGPPPTPAEYDTAKTLVGSYAAMIKYRENLTVGLAGSGSMVTTVFAMADIKDDAASKSVRLELALCEERIGSPTKHLMDLIVTVPGTALKMAHTDPAVLHASNVDGKVTWKAEEVHAIAGWKWSSPSDELPTKDDDARLVDQDGDGNPGVTATYTGGHGDGSLYLALQYRFLFSGAVGANGELTGTTMSSSREALLGSTEILLTGATIEREPDPDTSDNTIRLIPQPKGVSCEELSALKDTFFM
jgi:hypothetical protein